MTSQLVDPQLYLYPHPVLREMRTTCPVYFDDHLESWVVTRYDDVVACLKDPRMYVVEECKRVDALPQARQAELAPLRRIFTEWGGRTAPTTTRSSSGRSRSTSPRAGCRGSAGRRKGHGRARRRRRRPRRGRRRGERPRPPAGDVGGRRPARAPRPARDRPPDAGVHRFPGCWRWPSRAAAPVPGGHARHERVPRTAHRGRARGARSGLLRSSPAPRHGATTPTSRWSPRASCSPSSATTPPRICWPTASSCCSTTRPAPRAPRRRAGQPPAAFDEMMRFHGPVSTIRRMVL